MAIYKLMFIATNSENNNSIREVPLASLDAITSTILKVFPRVSNIPDEDELLNYMDTLRVKITTPYVECLYSELAVDDLAYFSQYGTHCDIKITFKRKNSSNSIVTTYYGKDIPQKVAALKKFKSVTVREAGKCYELTIDTSNPAASKEAAIIAEEILMNLHILEVFDEDN